LYSLHSRRFAGSWVYNGQQVEWSIETIDATAMAKFAEEFVGVFLFVQMGAVLLLTPAYTAGAIAEERQRGTLDCLLTTHLTPFQIVIGKLASRMAQLFGVLLTGLPVLALLPLWGGVSPEVILCGFAINGLTMLTVGAIGICSSARARSVRGAVASTYLIVGVSCLGLSCGCINPLLATGLFDDGRLYSDTLALGGLVVAAVVNLPLAAVFVHVAVRGLAARRGVAPRPGAAGARGLPADFHTGPWPYPDMVYPSPPVSDRPLLWKEMFVGGSGAVRVVMFILQMFIFIFVISLAVLLALVGGPGGDVEARDKLHDMVVVVIVVGLAAAMLGTLLQSTMCVGREREERTLDMLLTLPGGRGDVLRSKWLGSVLCSHLLPVGLLAVVVMGVIGGGMPWLTVPAIVVAASVHLAFAASLGLFLSVTIRSTARAGLMAAAVLFLLFVVPSVAIPGGHATIPPVTWVACLPPTIDSIGVTVLVGLMAYAGLGGVLWRLARARFFREVERAAIA
jgi:ABC-type transport system involved in multi-copper enzyme maturation permease subunit